VIVIDRGYDQGSGRPSTFADGVKVRLEDRLPELLRELEVRAVEAGRAKAAQRRAEEEREVRRLEEVERAKANLREAHRGALLGEQLQSWLRANQLRQYLTAMDEHIQAMDDEQERDAAVSWLSWARHHVANLDPFQGLLAMPEDSVMTSEDIRPFMNWSGI
jgi:hypothetical protein